MMKKKELTNNLHKYYVYKLSLYNKLLNNEYVLPEKDVIEAFVTKLQISEHDKNEPEITIFLDIVRSKNIIPDINRVNELLEEKNNHAKKMIDDNMPPENDRSHHGHRW